MVCTVHQLWDGFLADLPVGSHPFEGITADCARKRLRILLEKLRVPKAQEFGTHDCRRGHAEAGARCASLLFHPLCSLWQDMRRSGCSLAAILAAGQWKSSAFLRYLDESNLEKEVAFETAIDSEPDEWID